MSTNHTINASAIIFALVLAAPAVLAEQGYQAGTKQTQMGSERSSQPEPQGAMATTGKAGDNQASISVEKLEDTDVVNDAGDKLGEVDEIVRSKADDQLQAVVEVGGFLGVGAKEVAIPLKDLQMRNGKLIAPRTASTEKQIKSRAAYDESKYQELSEDQRIDRSEFAAFEASGKSSAGEGSGMSEGNQSHQGGSEGSTKY